MSNLDYYFFLKMVYVNAKQLKNGDENYVE